VITADLRSAGIGDDVSAAILDAIAGRTRTSAVIVCGSRATGHARADSDYDVLAVMPLLAIPFRLGRLAAAAADLEPVLGAPVSVNPMPRFRLRRPGRSLLVWKACMEGSVLSGDLSGARPEVLPLTTQAARSYALSGLRYLVSHVDPDADRRAWRSAQTTADVRKALLHVAQLSLLARGRYASSLADAVAQLDADLAREVEQLTSGADTLSAWHRTAELLRVWVGRAEEQPRSRLGDLQYLALSALSRRRLPLGVLVARRSVRARLATALELLVRSVRADGTVAHADVAAAEAVLPRHLRTGDPSFATVRDAVEREWPLADPLVGL
jgi:hypothetical protein